MENKKILDEVNAYYTDKIKTNGPTPQGVDWNGVESQNLRFEVLSGVVPAGEKFSILDYGCGYGGMYDYYKNHYHDFHFHGFDISEEMIRHARQLHGEGEHLGWYSDPSALPVVDYVVASGIFNVRLKNSDQEWIEYITATLGKINQIALRGFSFNILTSYSDKEYMRDYLYYADPLYLFDYCKKNFSKFVALRHDYPLYEFTIIVRK